MLKPVLNGILALLLVLAFPAVEASKLKDFEDKAGGKSDAPSPEGRSSSSDDDDDDDDGHRVGKSMGSDLGWRFLRGFSHFLFYDSIYDGGRLSLQRMSGPALKDSPQGASELPEREPGGSTAPILQLDADWLYVDKDIDALNVRAELGYGPLALQGRITEFTEELDGEADFELTLRSALALWRMSWTESSEFVIGMGAAEFEGDDSNSGFSVQLGVQGALTDWLDAEWRGNWTALDNSVRDNDYALIAHWKYFGLRAGYRRISTSNVTLDGPHVGIRLTW